MNRPHRTTLRIAILTATALLAACTSPLYSDPTPPQGGRQDSGTSSTMGGTNPANTTTNPASPGAPSSGAGGASTGSGGAGSGGAGSGGAGGSSTR